MRGNLILFDLMIISITMISVKADTFIVQTNPGTSDVVSSQFNRMGNIVDTFKIGYFEGLIVNTNENSTDLYKVPGVNDVSIDGEVTIFDENFGNITISAIGVYSGDARINAEWPGIHQYVCDKWGLALDGNCAPSPTTYIAGVKMTQPSSPVNIDVLDNFTMGGNITTNGTGSWVDNGGSDLLRPYKVRVSINIHYRNI